MLALVGPVGLMERARQLFDESTIRAYTAAVTGRRTRRVTYGAPRSYNLFLNAPTRVAFNSSKTRALRVYLHFLGNPPDSAVVGISAAPTIGSTDSGGLFSKAPGAQPTQMFVLKPEDQLWVQLVNTTITPAPFAVAQEWV